MPKDKGPSRARRHHATPPSVEERLHEMRAQFALLADVFELHACAIDHGDGPSLGAEAAYALVRICRHASRDVHALLRSLPVVVLNDSPRAAPQRD